MSQSLYDVLQVSSDADMDVIEAAYQLRKKKLEGDLSGDSRNELIKIKWAYDTLIDADKRVKYDSELNKNRLPPKLAATDDVAHQEPAGFMAWWNSHKTTGVMIGVGALVILAIMLNYKKESNITDVEKIRVEKSEANVSKHLDNEGEAIGVVSDIATQEQERRRVELEYKANAGSQIIDLQRQRQEQQLEMQRQQLEMMRQRQEAALKMQQQQIEQQRALQEQNRIQREQRYYSCYNAAWSRFGGDGSRAELYCSSYK